MKKEKNQKEEIEEVSLSNKEQEILDEYDDVEENYIVEENRPVRTRRSTRLVNIIFIIIIVLVIMATIDIIAVKKYDKGPFFAIPIHTYKDGGTKEYFGFGYKVFKYNQIQGRRDKEIGSWKLKYNATPISTDAIDLAIEFNNDETASYTKYYKKFMRITGLLTRVSQKEKTITISYIDEDGKYNLDIVCDMKTDKDKLETLSTNTDVTVIGTLTNYKYKTKEDPATIYLSNCFAEQ